MLFSLPYPVRLSGARLWQTPIRRPKKITVAGYRYGLRGLAARLLFANRFYRASSGAGTAAHAGSGVDNALVVLLADRVDRALALAGAAIDAGIGIDLERDVYKRQDYPRRGCV